MVGEKYQPRALSPAVASAPRGGGGFHPAGVRTGLTFIHVGLLLPTDASREGAELALTAD